ncbi:hypothetical protein EVAR_12403_1 [Eumeta japonica]|uniref:Uncharacterized protein n=1 Tax=Eumeta variegata TaxID=151549 RepID=A0A4C1TZ71_EUMVA|nr:hypothetical protein EVAR_12403_1 [Eumeta japonica]
MHLAIVQRTKLCRSELPANDVMRSFNASRPSFLLPRLAIFHHCDAFVTNFTEAEFRGGLDNAAVAERPPGDPTSTGGTAHVAPFIGTMIARGSALRATNTYEQARGTSETASARAGARRGAAERERGGGGARQALSQREGRRTSLVSTADMITGALQRIEGEPPGAVYGGAAGRPVTYALRKR